MLQVPSCINNTAWFPLYIYDILFPSFHLLVLHHLVVVIVHTSQRRHRAIHLLRESISETDWSWLGICGSNRVKTCLTSLMSSSASSRTDSVGKTERTSRELVIQIWLTNQVTQSYTRPHLRVLVIPRKRFYRESRAYSASVNLLQ